MKKHTKNKKTNLQKIGYETEELAKEELKKMFVKIYWKSKINPLHYFDFECYDIKGNRYLIDVKSCVQNTVLFKIKKLLLLRGICNFYFFLYDGKKFELMSFDELLNSNKIKIGILGELKFKNGICIICKDEVKDEINVFLEDNKMQLPIHKNCLCELIKEEIPYSRFGNLRIKNNKLTFIPIDFKEITEFNIMEESQ